jgi:glutamyl-tRNA reductase
MVIRVIGSNHRLTPPSQLQGAVACREAIFARLLTMQSAGRIRGAILLGTCNRLEIIIDTDREDDPGLPHGLLAEHTDIPRHDLYDAAASHYLLRVATGLESMVRGEDQILGQLRAAFKRADEHGLLSPTLRVLRTDLIAAARDLRQRTGLVKSKVSVASLAARQLERGGTRFAVVGAGETGRLAVEALIKRGFTDLLVVNRTVQRAAALARHFGLEAMALSDFLTAAEARTIQLDGVLFAIDSPLPVFELRHVGDIEVLVDVSMPSVIDGPVREAQGVEVIDLDRIAVLVESESDRRQARFGTAEELVRAKAGHLHQRLIAVHSGAEVHLSQILERHLDNAMQELHTVLTTKLSHLSDIDQEQVRQALVRAAKRNAHIHLKDVRELSRS